MARSVPTPRCGRAGLSLPASVRGFTLLEVLLAFVVFAMSFAVVLEIIGGSMRSTVRAAQYSEAALLAQSLMEGVGVETPLMPGSFNGETAGGFDWTIDISDYEDPEEDSRVLELAEMNGTNLYWVDITLRWDTGLRDREMTFTSVRSVLQGDL